MFAEVTGSACSARSRFWGRIGAAVGVASLLVGLLSPAAASAAEPVRVPWTTSGTDVRAYVSTLQVDPALGKVGGITAIGDSLFIVSGSRLVRVSKATGAATPVAGSATEYGCVDAPIGATARFGGDSYPHGGGAIGAPILIGSDGQLLYVRDRGCGVRTVDPDTGATRTITEVAGSLGRGVPKTITIVGQTLYSSNWDNDLDYVQFPTEVYQRDLATGVTTTLAQIPESIDVIVADDTYVWAWGNTKMHRVDRLTGERTEMPYPFNFSAGGGDITYRGAGPFWDGQVVSVGDYFYFVIPGFYDWQSVGRIHKFTGERNDFAYGVDDPEVESPYGEGNMDRYFNYLSGLAFDGSKLYIAEYGTWMIGGTARNGDLHVVTDGYRLPQPVDPEEPPGPEPTPEPTPSPSTGLNKYVALGDSYSSGYGMGDYDLGTNEEGGNDCQRSEHAYSKLVAETLGLDLSFHACQGAVSKHFYERRFGDAGNDWGELPQLDHITPDTGLVSFTIGGNDAKFAEIYKECVDGWEIFRWNTCHEDDKVTVPLAKAFARLDGGGDNGDPELLQVHPYREIFGDARDRSPFAQRVVVGYPAFFPEGGSDQSNCEGIDRVDQAWMHDKTLELNATIKKNAELNGFRYVDPNRESVGFGEHGLCSEDSWFYGAFHAGQIHPRRPGHKALAKAIIEELTNDVRPSFKVMPHATVVTSFTAPASLESLYVGIEWPGSDIQLSLVSPSGQVYSRTELPGGAVNSKGPTWDGTKIPNPEAGVWKVRMYGADVDPQGEEARLTVSHVEVPNRLPVGTFDVRLLGSRLELDGSRSSDSDGQVTAYRWYVKTDENAPEKVLEGQKVSVDVPIGKPVRVSLAVTDDEDATSYVTRRATTVPVDVKPGSVENPINLRSKGVTPLAILSTEQVNASEIDVQSLRVGPKAAPAVAGVGWSDLNDDGRIDLTMRVLTQDLGLSASDTELGVSGVLLDGRLLVGSDRIRLMR